MILKIQGALILLIIGAFLNCLQYVKISKFHSEKELSRQFEKVKSDYSVAYRLTNNSIIFNISEVESTFDKVTKEKTYKLSNQADTSARQKCISEVYGTYWECMLGIPAMTFGIGYIVTIPIIFYDWLTYPFYVAFSDSKTEIVEQSLPSGNKREVTSPKAKLRLKNEDTKLDKTFTFKDGRIEIPFSSVNVNNLWNSGDQNSGKKFYYYYTILDLKDQVLIPETVFDGVKFRDDQNFARLSNLQYEKEKKEEYNRCARRFSLDTVRDGYKYIYDSGLYLRENEIVVQIILNRACYNYKGTSNFDDCVDDFKACIASVRYIDNQNLRYKKD